MRPLIHALPLSWAVLRKRLAAVLLLPAAILAACLLLPGQLAGAAPTAGFVLPAEEADRSAASSVYDLLAQNEAVHFVLTDEETARREIAAGRWLCAYVPAADFASRLSDTDTDRLFTVLTPAGADLSPLVNEAVAAAVLTLRAPDLAADYASEAGFAGAAEARTIRERTAAGLSPDQAMTFSIETVAGTAPASDPYAALRTVLLGLSAIYLLLLALLWAAGLRRLRKRGWFPLAAASVGTFPLVFALALISGAALIAGGAASLLLIAWFLGGSLSALVPMAMYGTVLAALTLFLSAVPGTDAAIPAVLPFLPVLCLFLCPVFLDAAAWFPFCGPLSESLPPTWFLDAVRQGKPGLWMAAAAAVLTAASAVLLRDRRSGLSGIKPE